jgi:hypothetical protein
MATTTTTTTAALTPSDWLVFLTNKAALRVGDTLTVTDGAKEAMRVLVVDPAAGTPVIVYRGSEGTNGGTWPAAANVTYGQPTDFNPGSGATRAGLEPFLSQVRAEREAEQLEADEKEAEARAKKAGEAAAKAAEAAEKAAEAAEKAAAAKNEPHRR